MYSEGILNQSLKPEPLSPIAGPSWDLDRIAAFAPDEASIQAARGLAGLNKWLSPGRSSGERGEPAVIWGECPGSGAKPYRTRALLDPTASVLCKCSCPSRKFPCKHSLGLLLCHAATPEKFTPGPEPEWVKEWLDERQQAAAAPPDSQSTAPKKRGPTPESEARRRQNVTAGLQELSLWLEDLLRQGIAGLPAEPYRFFDQMAARMVDAQAPGLARMLRELPGLCSSGPDWAEQVLERLGLMHLLISAYERIESLDSGLQAEIRSQIGWTIQQESLLAEPGTQDEWLILGQVLGVEERLRLRRTWLLGRHSGNYALLLDFAFGSQPFKQAWMPGSLLEAELVWFPSSFLQRALVKPGWSVRPGAASPVGYPDWKGLRRYRAEALARHPWLDLMPACLENATPHLQLDRLWLRDQRGDSLPLWQGFDQSWRLLALSGGHPLTLSLEFDGERVYPLGVWCEDGYVPLNSEEET